MTDITNEKPKEKILIDDDENSGPTKNRLNELENMKDPH